MARLVVVAPGRGTYNRSELGYLQRFADHPRGSERQTLVAKADTARRAAGALTVSDLDGADTYQSSRHLPGENASALIFTCTAADYALISPTHQVLAVTGNSMGWYSTLYTGGALSFANAFRVVDTMGAYQKGNIQGGQIIYPVIDADWRIDLRAESEMESCMNEINQNPDDGRVWHSIDLGGFRVLAGNRSGLKALLDQLPPVKLGANDYPFQLARHAAFHTPLMAGASQHGLDRLTHMDWHQPKIPMIDGRGQIWRRFQSLPRKLERYTLVHQVLERYDFTLAVRVALREYNPDHLVLLGPGETLGGAIAHVMIAEKWRGIQDKADFLTAQKSDSPPLIAMNRPDQAALLI